MLKTLLPLGLLLAAAVPQIASAQEAARPLVRVSYADLNLANPSGVAELDRRIARAIDTACPEAQSRFIPEVHAEYACRAAAKRSIAPQRERALAARTGNLLVATGR